MHHSTDYNSDPEYITGTGYTEIKLKKINRIRFDPILTSVVTCFGLVFVISIVYTGIIVIPFLSSFSELISITIPNEIDFYHSLFAQHNKTIVSIEQNALQIMNSQTLKNLNDTIYQLNILSKQINMTQIQYDLNQIVNILQRLIQL